MPPESVLMVEARRVLLDALEALAELRAMTLLRRTRPTTGSCSPCVRTPQSR